MSKQAEICPFGAKQLGEVISKSGGDIAKRDESGGDKSCHQILIQLFLHLLCEENKYLQLI